MGDRDERKVSLVLLTIEKVVILKSVKIFSETPDEYLVDVANILKEVHAKAGQEIFKKGDIGTAMYIIVEGKVRVHDETREFAVLRDPDVFGELSALDPEPRSATATAIEDTHLFCLEGDALFELMAENIEVARGIIHVLCQRMRVRSQNL